MTRVAVSCVALVVWAATFPVAQESTPFTPADFVSSWTLTSMERGVSGEKPERIQNPRGLLIFDAAGHAFEFFTAASRQQPETPQTDPLGMFAAYGGFWGVRDGPGVLSRLPADRARSPHHDVDR